MEYIKKEWKRLGSISLIVAGVLTANRWGALRMKEGLALAWDKLRYVFGRGSAY